jgi:hypothetical protein
VNTPLETASARTTVAVLNGLLDKTSWLNAKRQFTLPRLDLASSLMPRTRESVIVFLHHLAPTALVSQEALVRLLPASHLTLDWFAYILNVVVMMVSFAPKILAIQRLEHVSTPSLLDASAPTTLVANSRALPRTSTSTARHPSITKRPSLARSSH